ncbi:MAG TPA: hypothetical protein VN823_16530 [Stellaceae bacterium]|nr:hypothetical protein [Stellaceae bacterium]
MSIRPVFRFLAVLLLTLAVSASAHARVFVSLGFPFFPFYYGPSYDYPPAYYYPPPYYYPPQQGYYPPQQGYAPDAYAQPSMPATPPQTVSPTAARNCRTYRGDATIDSSGKPFYGRACLESDGRWHVVQ